MEVQKAKRAAEILKRIEEITMENDFLENDFFKQIDFHYKTPEGKYDFFRRIGGCCKGDLFITILNNAFDSSNRKIIEKLHEIIDSKVGFNNCVMSTLKKELEEL